MRKEKTVFIVGAGASKEVGLPTGDELKKLIQQNSNIRYDTVGRRLESGNYEIANAINEKSLEIHSEGRHSILPKAWIIGENMPIAPSIDNFLDTHQHDREIVECGKILLAATILQAERNSKLFRAEPFNTPFSSLFSTLENYWLQKLFKKLVAERQFEDFLSALKEISFISFNYDRCIQLFLTEASRTYFGLSPEDVEKLDRNLNIIYPYGTLGRLTIQRGFESDFGGELRKDRILRAANSLKTFTEQVDSEAQGKIEEAMVEAKNISFLGFGFHMLNLNLLFQDLPKPMNVETSLGTSLGLSSDSTRIMSERLSHLMDNRTNPKLVEKKCYEFFDEFSARFDEFIQ